MNQDVNSSRKCNTNMDRTRVWEELKQICHNKNSQLEERERYLQTKMNNNGECKCLDHSVKDTSHKVTVNIDSASLKSLDVDYMSRVVDLFNREKLMKKNIEKLEKREQTYKDILKEFDSGQGCKCEKDNSLRTELDKINEELRNENKILVDELDDMRLELKQCLERIEGPMQHQLERERVKGFKLEKQLQLATEAMMTSQNCFLREMNNIKMQLTNVADLNVKNQKFKNELCELVCKCAELGDDSAKQELNEVEKIKRISRSKERQQNMKKSNIEDACICPSGQSPKVEECSDLYTVARRLSESLKQTIPCDECSNLPKELVDTARGLKDIADMVIGKGPKKEIKKVDQLNQVQSRQCQCDIKSKENSTTEAKVDAVTSGHQSGT